MAGARRQSAPQLGPTSEIPDKLYFKIGEVAQLVGVQAHVLRYWEKEIPFIRPGKTASNQRRYRRRDVEVFREIRRLLHQERYTLAGARRRLMSGDRGREEHEPATNINAASPEPEAPPGEQLALGLSSGSAPERLERVRAGLRELIEMAGEEEP